MANHGQYCEKYKCFAIGIYHGYCKPNDANIFLQDFVNEISNIINNRFFFKNILYQIYIHCITWDTPAKFFITKTKGHTGYYSCTKCCIEGEYIQNRLCFPDLNIQLKTDNGFIQQAYDDYHQGQTVLCDILNLKPVSQIPLDYMHLVCIGILKKVV